MDRSVISAIVVANLLAPVGGWLTLVATDGVVGVGLRVLAALAVAGGFVALARRFAWNADARLAVGAVGTATAGLGFGGYYALSWSLGQQYPFLLFLAAVGFFTSAAYGPGWDTLTS